MGWNSKEITYDLVVMRHADMLTDEVTGPPLAVIRQVDKVFKELQKYYKGELAFAVLLTDDECSRATARMLSDRWKRSQLHTWQPQDVRTIEVFSQVIAKICRENESVVLIADEEHVCKILTFAGIKLKRPEHAVPFYLRMHVKGRKIKLEALK